MQTFLPFPDFTLSASVLDRQRLGKQRVEAKQILLSLTTPSYGWKNHPAVRMWRGYEPALARYGVAICTEWRSRGYRDSLLPFFTPLATTGPNPPWLGFEPLHSSHRAALLYKLPSYYSRFFWEERPNLAYVWPETRGDLCLSL